MKGVKSLTTTVMIDSQPFVEGLGVVFSGKGKVRDSYTIGDRLLVVATDRISTYDAVHPNGIPEKGLVLSKLSAFWFLHPDIAAICPNHFLSLVGDWFPTSEGAVSCPGISGRALLVKKAEIVYPVECIVRGYITGSAWAEYSDRGTVSGKRLRSGLLESEEFPEPLFTPTTKARVGHDKVVNWREFADLVGSDRRARRLRDWSIQLYVAARDYALKRGVIIADTKFEFGDGMLIDEVLTPDSSRFWDTENYEPGRAQESFDKQFVRDWASNTGWDKNPPAPEIPKYIVAGTQNKYRQIFSRLTGLPFPA